MNSAAVRKAKIKLERMRLAIETTDAANEPATIEEAWVGFVMAGGSFYSTLEQGAKENGKSRQWFGRKKQERKSDALLSYLHRARNAEEHGIKRITARKGEVLLKSQGAAASFVWDGKAWKIYGLHGGAESIVIVVLVRVRDDRFGDWFDPPTLHLGQKLVDVSPPAVAKLGFSYLGEMLSEAIALAR